MNDQDMLPTIIQGGMGVSVSGWQLARSVSQTGELGVVSGTALDVVCARRLMMGDPGGHVRQALAAFPIPAMARRVMKRYYIHGGKAADEPFRAVPRFTVTPPVALQELTVVGAFCEVWLAKQEHSGPVGINFLRKIEIPLPFGLLGAMLADVDYILIGAGNPAEIPAVLRALAQCEDVEFGVRTQGLRSVDAPVSVRCSPAELLDDAGRDLALPRFLAIVASLDLAAGLARDPSTRPFGFIVEGPSAGGHNAPPRGPRRVDELGQPVYDERDTVDLDGMAALGLPFWLAGGYGTPAGLTQARAAGAQGIQVGTAFAYSQESGLADSLKRQVLGKVLAGTLDVRSDWRASPTGFPFRVIQLEGTVSDPEIAAARKAVCDLGALRTPFIKANGDIDYRCPAEPLAVYTRKGGRAQNAEGRQCLCNALMAAADFPQQRPDGSTEPAIVTSGDDFQAVLAVASSGSDGGPYPARAVVDYLRAGLTAG
ncbi:MAG: nitronate monooxygenase [Candidatus Nanopelagicales bacterium]|nr:nitronate monooxygenase [Candidatus Nanopelagicales bacterium]